MLRHVVAFSAKRKENIPDIKEGLSMLGSIPGVQNFVVTDNLQLDQISEHMDVIVYAEFDSVETLEEFKLHQTYQDCIDVVKPLREKRIVLDFYLKQPQEH